ncbi:MAG: chorismate-binding protein, partial [Lachnospiraceae bacterium]|nr:chorismate-binding protein [Lachnospiraceae bacterium]
MNLIPDLNRIKEISKTGEYTVVPVSTQILSDFITPIEALRILKNASDHVYMLESAKADETWGRYTFLGFEPKMLITCKDGVLTAGDKTIKTDDPSSEIRKIMAEYKSPRVEELNFFTGGLVGYFSFEYFGYSEPTIRSSLEDENEFKDVDLMLFDKVIAFDNLSQKIHLIANIKLSDIENEYERAKGELKRIADLLRNGKKKEEPASRLLGQIKPLFDKERFCQMVTDAKNYIREGDIFQIVLSNRLSAPFEGSLLDTYRELRTINTSPYMFYFSGTDV